MVSRKSPSSARSAPKAEPPFLAALARAARGPAPGTLLAEAQAAVRSPQTQRVYSVLLREARDVRQVERSHRRNRMTVPPLSLPPVA
jgi:hypothetical protein